MSATQDGRYYQRYQVGYGSQHWMELRRNGTNNWLIDENEIHMAISSPFELWTCGQALLFTKSKIRQSQ